MVLYVVRHGQTDANVNHLFNGINPFDLTETGVAQAEALRPEVAKIRPDAIYSSPLKRALHTAEILNPGGLEVITDDRLIERECGKYTLKPTSLIDTSGLFDKDYNPYEDFESYASILKRTEDFIEDMKKTRPGEKILVVTHGDVILGFFEYFDRRKDPYPDTCRLIRFELD